MTITKYWQNIIPDYSSLDVQIGLNSSSRKFQHFLWSKENLEKNRHKGHIFSAKKSRKKGLMAKKQYE